LRISGWTSLVVLAVVACCGCRPRPDLEVLEGGEDQALISISLSTEPSQVTGAGGFKGSVMAHERDVGVIHDCAHAVEAVVETWERDQPVTLVARERSRDGLELMYSAKDPPGYFFLRYRQGGDTATVAFWFRDLANRKLSGDEVGLRPLGRRLLEAVQCVP